MISYNTTSDARATQFGKIQNVTSSEERRIVRAALIFREVDGCLRDAFAQLPDNSPATRIAKIREGLECLVDTSGPAPAAISRGRRRDEFDLFTVASSGIAQRPFNPQRTIDLARIKQRLDEWFDQVPAESRRAGQLARLSKGVEGALRDQLDAARREQASRGAE